MSQPAVSARAPLPFELVYDYGESFEDPLHLTQINLLSDLIDMIMIDRGKDDVYFDGDQFVYASVEQAREVARQVEETGRPLFRGPDLFFVDHVQPGMRRAWLSWEEGGKLPDLIVEVLSPKTAKVDRTIKKDVYARHFRTREYFLCDLYTTTLEGYRLAGDLYQPIPPDRHGRLRSEVLDVWFGFWRGVQRKLDREWVRFFDADGRLIPTSYERADEAEARLEAQLERVEAERQRAEAVEARLEAERQRAEAERRRAEAAEAELQRLRALLGEQSGQSQP
jgi:Uma2 family endonuclease